MSTRTRILVAAFFAAAIPAGASAQQVQPLGPPAPTPAPDPTAGVQVDPLSPEPAQPAGQVDTPPPTGPVGESYFLQPAPGAAPTTPGAAPTESGTTEYGTPTPRVEPQTSGVGNQPLGIDPQTGQRAGTLEGAGVDPSPGAVQTIPSEPIDGDVDRIGRVDRLGEPAPMGETGRIGPVDPFAPGAEGTTEEERDELRPLP